MSIIKSRFGERDFAREIGFEPVAGNTATDVQKAIENNLSAQAPGDAQYYVAAAHSGLDNEIVVPAFIQTLLDDTSASAARTTLGVAIGVNVQAYDPDLDTWAGLTPSANAQSLVTAADYAAMRALLDLEIGTDVQAYSANLDLWAAEIPSDYALLATLASTANGNGASLIGIEDAGGLITATTVEAALAENRVAIDAIEADYLTSSDIGVSVQAYDADLDTWAGLTPSANFQTLVTQTFAQMRASLDLEAGTDFYSIAGADAAFQPLDSDLTAIAALSTQAAGRSFLTIADPNADRIYFWDDSAGAFVALTLAGALEISDTTLRVRESFVIACSDETTDLTTGTAKVTFRMPYAFTLTAVRASVNTAPTGSTIIVDINENGTTILSTKLSIDASEETSMTAASAAVISDASLADDAEITIDFDQVGSSTPGKGLKVALIGYRP